MRKDMRLRLLRLLAFAFCTVCFIVLGNFFLIRSDLFTWMMMQEMHRRSDIEIAFVGSSVCRNHVNTRILTEKTGKRTFSASVPDLAMQGSLAITEDLFRTNHPELVVLMVDSYTFDTDLESVEAEDFLMPWLSSPQTQLRYYLNLTRSDGWYLDRLLLFRDFGARGPADILKTIRLRLFPETVLNRYGTTAIDKGAIVSYEGSGFLRYETETRADDDIRERLQRNWTGWYYDLFPRSKEMLIQYRDMAAAHQAQLLVLISPALTAQNLADPSYSGYNESLMRFCRKNDIPCYDFSLAKPNCLPCLDAYYYDLFHLIGEGADLFSEALAGFLTGWLSGKNLQSDFYGSYREYFESIDFVTNTWIEMLNPSLPWDPSREQSPMDLECLGSCDIYLANSNHGTGFVPEYRFVCKAKDGEIPLGDWQTEGILTCEHGRLRHETIRVYARNPSDPERLVWYDYSPAEEY